MTTFNNLASKHASNSSLWPYKEALRLSKTIDINKDEVVFETGYGPSGLPHLGTFSEVVRTSWVRKAFEEITGKKTKLIVFSDDMDGLRKVPENVPNKEMLSKHINQPLTKVPDPFGEFNSFAEQNNTRLCNFLDDFGFEYSFYSATKCYQSGLFDETLILALKNYQEIMNIILPDLGPDRQMSYSPFMPICPETGKVLQVATLSCNVTKGTFVYKHPNGQEIETDIRAGKCKCQWKLDWALRWATFKVDYEIYGKDIIPSADLSGKIVKKLNFKKPQGFFYEHFLDEKGAKISKSKGNGISMEEWLTYAPTESLSYYLFAKPRTAKRLYFGVIPKAVDDFYSFESKLKTQTKEESFSNPARFIVNQNELKTNNGTTNTAVSFSLLLNLATVCHAKNTDDLWAFLQNTTSKTTRTKRLEQLLKFAINYSNDKVRPFLKPKTPNKLEKESLLYLAEKLKQLQNKNGNAEFDEIQSVVFDVGKHFDYNPLRNWFLCLYQCLLGQESGPRMGSFFALYGIENSIKLIKQSIANTSSID